MTSPSSRDSSQVLRINLDIVAHKTIDNEVIIINLDTGTYCNLVDVALGIWQGLEVGAPEDQLVEALCGVYCITTEASCEAVDALLAEEILAPADAVAPSSPPLLTTYTNMSDLLMLDPIDDVDEQGWPSAPPREAGE